MLAKTSRVATFLFLLLTFSLVFYAQEPPAGAQDNVDKNDLMGTLRFRNLGPAVGGGRVTAVAGVPGKPNIYYIGAAAGGVFKTMDGGLSWKPIFEHEANSSIGAIALAPSNPNVIWVGTGESNPRNDVVTGRGVYLSTDGGASWRLMGLENTGHIAQIVVHPTNPDIVYVGALGHVWGPNQDRGVFRTLDGGKTWQKVLYIDDKTGVSDLVMDPGNPMVLFAGMWNLQRHPWVMLNGGETSGIFRSTDGGATWKKLSEGLPKGPIGRIGLAIAPSNPYHVYALIDAKRGVLWDSNDLGDHWREVSNNHQIDARPFYFTQLRVAPNNENKLYFLSFSIMTSDDGGKTARNIGRGVHPDHHALWIDPTDANRLINGNDGGVYISTDAGRSWNYRDNIPIEQFYQVATDDKNPYMICGGLQDNNGWCGPSNSLSRGGIDGGEWWTAVGGDGQYIVPAGKNSNAVYADSQNGVVVRLDDRYGLSKFIRPYLPGVSQMPPSELKYRFNWTSPIAVGPDPNTVFIGGNVLFKSTDGGVTWNPISGDLTRNDKSKQIASGGPVELDLSGAETFDTILSIAVSQSEPNVIWVGTDDGVVQVTRDGGKTWANVTPKGAPEWGRLQQIEVSPFSPDTAYVAIDLHEMDNQTPFLFKTHDYGKTWTAITNGVRPNESARVVREDPNKKGFLVLGTDTGLYFSHDDGGHWTPLKGNFPTVPVYDIRFHKQQRDLIVATHGRGLFVLDNDTPLAELTPEIENSDFHLFPVAQADRWVQWNKRGFNRSDFVAPNPPNGAVIDYYVKNAVEQSGGNQQPAAEGGQGPQGGQAAAQGNEPAGRGRRRGPVKITVADESGKTIRTLYGPARHGFNRVTWDMRYAEEVPLSFRPVPEENEFFQRGGPPVIPGTYKVTVTFNGRSQTQNVQIGPDPRFPADMAAFKAQAEAALEVRDELSAVNESLNRLEAMRAQLASMQRIMAGDDEVIRPASNVNYGPLLSQSRDLDKKLRAVEEKVFNPDIQPEASDQLRFHSRLHDRLQGLLRSVSAGYDQAPTPLLMEEMNSLREQTQAYLQQFNSVVSTDVTAFNKNALEHGASTLFTGTPLQLNKETQAGED
jgi:photosystem II stability/assembly factor-like uncharacterized protein